MSATACQASAGDPLYLYAIVPLGPDGAAPDIDASANGVSVIGNGRHAAVVGRGAPLGLEGRSREELGHLLVAHQETVERIMRASPLLPVRFGTQLPDEVGVRKVLEDGSSLFEGAFAELRGRTQLEIRVTWDLEAVFARLAAEQPLAALREGLATATVAERETFGRRVKDALEARRAALAAEVTDALSSVTIDNIVYPVIDDRVVVQMALLIDTGAIEAVDGRLEALDAATGGTLRFRCVGPMPPSSFATVEIDAVDAEAVERARQVLQIDERANFDDVRAAYLRRAREAHPDAGKGDGPGAMAELTEAYHVLSHYARAAGVAGLSRRNSSAAILVSLRRQESDGTERADAG